MSGMRLTSLLLDEQTDRLLNRVGTKGPYLRNLVLQHAREAQSCWLSLQADGWHPMEIQAVAAALNGVMLDPATMPLSVTLPAQLEAAEKRICPTFGIEPGRWQSLIQACRNEPTAYAVYRLVLEIQAGNIGWLSNINPVEP